MSLGIFSPHLTEMLTAGCVSPRFLASRVNEVTGWLSTHKAFIQLNLRYKSDDQLWFTFFHEACHTLRHGKEAVFIGYDKRPLNAKEQEADAFAADFLIPPTRLSEFLQSGDLNKTSIQSFASRIGIAPGIVVGRLQHDHILPFIHSNDSSVA